MRIRGPIASNEPGRGAGGLARFRLPAILVGVAAVAGLVGITVLWTSSTAGTTHGRARGHGPEGRQAPNIIVIQTDDQDTVSMTRQVMPSTMRLLGKRGTTFSDYIDSGPLCCPSRAVMLTGQYGHNNGVLWNDPNPYGDLRGKDNTLPVWLQRAGYRTAHIGKYLNNYAVGTGDPNEVAPGWDQWDTVLEESSKTPVSYYDYTLRENGRAVPYGSDPRDYVTRVLDHKAVDFIDRYGGPHRHPLFMALDEIAPHQASNRGDPRCQSSALPAPRDSKLFENKPLPMPPSFNEADVSDKPWFIRVEPRLTAADIADMKRRQDCRLASLRAVDRGIKQVVAALRRKHEMKNTAFLFTSDNGYLQGEHREHAKVDPYEEALHVPLIVRLPADMRDRHTPRALSTTVANIDIAPTILRLAGAKPCSGAGDCRVLDGRSLLKAIRTDGRKWPHDRGILLELKGQRAGKTQPCNYQGVRTQHQVFVRYLGVTRQLEGHGPCMPDGEAEHYNLRRDPYELRNLHPPNPGSPSATEEQTLSKRLERLRDCAGIKGRDPEPPSGHYCG